MVENEGGDGERAGRCCGEALVRGGRWAPAGDRTWRRMGHWDRMYDLGTREQFAKFRFKEHSRFSEYLESIQEHVLDFCIYYTHFMVFILSLSEK